MSTPSTTTAISKLPFVPDPAVGNPFFRVNNSDSIVNYRRADFLVPHRKDYYFMAFVRKGGSRHWVDMTPYVLKANTFYFTVPHQVHLKEESQPLTGATISFTEEFLGFDEGSFLRTLPIIRNPYNGHELHLSPPDVQFIESLLTQIDAEYRGGAAWQHNMLMAYFRTLLIYLSRLYTGQFSDEGSVPDRLLLKKYRSLIDESYARLHEVADYAGLLNISAGHLSDVVKEQSGKPAIVHIHERLVLEARRLLFHTDLSAKEISFELGFEDASYFNRFFKRITQQTPGEYRAFIREMYH